MNEVWLSISLLKILMRMIWNFFTVARFHRNSGTATEKITSPHQWKTCSSQLVLQESLCFLTLLKQFLSLLTLKLNAVRWAIQLPHVFASRLYGSEAYSLIRQMFVWSQNKVAKFCCRTGDKYQDEYNFSPINFKLAMMWIIEFAGMKIWCNFQSLWLHMLFGFALISFLFVRLLRLLCECQI